jgi:hypothetical protein
MRFNETTIYTVQPYSGADDVVFSSFEEAESYRAECIRAASERFDATGEGGDSRLEPDLYGGCYESFVLSDNYLPGSIYTHQPGTYELS